MQAQRLVEEGIQQLLSVRIAGSCAALLIFPQKASPILPKPFRIQTGAYGSSSGLRKRLLSEDSQR